MLREFNERSSLALTPLFVFAASGVPSISPDKSKAPGAAGLGDAINAFAWYALAATAAGFLLGGCVWAVGNRGGNDYAATGGKVGMAVSVGVAFLIGGAKAILDFAYGAGGT